MKKIVIVDYGLSNLLSVDHAFRHLGVTPIISHHVEDILSADALILPGVGAFADGMKSLSALNLSDAIISKAEDGTPFVGICLGMQMLFDESEEFGIHKGLGLIPGRVVKIPSIDIDGQKQKIPHISWNPLYPPNHATAFEGNILKSTTPGDECYFIHSYECKPSNSYHCIAETTYGGRRICAIAKNENIIGMQFHPEKSGEVGLTILKNIIDIYC